MSDITITRLIAQPIHVVWPVLSDFAGTAVYNPEVLASRSANGLETGLGARRRCEFDPGGKKWTEEEIVEYDDANTRFVLQIMDGPAAPPIETVRVEISATSEDFKSTVVSAVVSLKGVGAKQKILAWLGRGPIRASLERVFAGLDHYLATGEEVANKKFLKERGVAV